MDAHDRDKLRMLFGMDGAAAESTADRVMGQLCVVGRMYCDPEARPEATAAHRWDLLKTHAGSCSDCTTGLLAYARASGARLAEPFTLRVSP